MSKKKLKLPEFKTEEEFTEFFETHDLADYWHEFEPAREIELAVSKPKDEEIVVRLSPTLLSEIKKIAAQKGTSHQALIQQWLSERLAQEKATA